MIPTFDVLQDRSAPSSLNPGLPVFDETADLALLIAAYRHQPVQAAPATINQVVYETPLVIKTPPPAKITAASHSPDGPLQQLAAVTSVKAVVPGQTFTVDLTFAANASSTGTGDRLSYDSKQVKVVNLQVDTPRYFIGVEDQGGSILVGYASLTGNFQPNGSGSPVSLVTVTFQAQLGFTGTTFTVTPVFHPAGWTTTTVAATVNRS